MTSWVKDCTDVTESPGLSSVFADKLDAKNNLPSHIGTHTWERMRKEEWGACLPLGAAALLGCCQWRVQIKFAHRIFPIQRSGAPGVCEHSRRPPRPARRALHPLPGFHTPLYFQVSALPRSQPPALSRAGWHPNLFLSQ